MNTVFKRPHRKPFTTTKVLNALLVLLLMVSLLPTPVQAASMQQPSSDNNVFLPLVISSSAQVMSSQSNLGDGGTTPRKLRYEVGKLYQYEYAVKINASSAKRDAQGIQEDGSETTLIEAIANLTITGQEDDGAYVGELALQDPALSRTDGSTTYVVDDAEMLKALAIPLRFKQAVNGVITEVSSPADAPVQVVNIQKGVLNALQVTLMEGEDRYVAQEYAGQGTVQVTYTLQEQGDGLHITKQYNQDSFAKLIMTGDQHPGLQLQNAIDIVVDREQGLISSIVYNEAITSGDGAAAPDHSGTDFDGVTTWSTVKSTGRLTLQNVTDAVSAAATGTANYTTDSLDAALTEGYPNHEGIDLSQVDLGSELARLESEPDSPEHHARILTLVEADSGDPNDNIDVLKTITARLQASASNDAVASAYVDVLGSVGTPQAQEILNAVLGNGQAYPELAQAPFGTVAKDQALINVALLESPTSTTVDTVKSLAKGGDAALHDTAVTVLGAIADHLSDEDPAQAQQLADLLEANLALAGAPEEVELYLNALGNAGESSSLDVIRPYIYATVEVNGTSTVTDDLAIQATALVALRKIAGNEAESLLVDALTDKNKPDNLRVLVANVLSEREELSKAAQTALEGFELRLLAAPGRYSQSWTRLLGNYNLGVEFPGGIDVASPPATSGLYGYAHQAANAWIYGRSLNVVKGELRTFRAGNYQVFGAYLGIANNLIRRQFELQVPCADYRTGNLYSGTVQFLNATFRIPVFAVITLDINVRASGSFTLDWNFSVDMCALNVATLQAGITPRAWATASASAYLDLVVARGGATLTATLLNTEAPAQTSLIWDARTTPAALRFCIDIKVRTQALSGYLDVWADVRVPRWGWPPYEWRRVGSARLWTFSTPSNTYNLFVQCF